MLSIAFHFDKYTVQMMCQFKHPFRFHLFYRKPRRKIASLEPPKIFAWNWMMYQQSLFLTWFRTIALNLDNHYPESRMRQFRWNRGDGVHVIKMRTNWIYPKAIGVDFVICDSFDAIVQSPHLNTHLQSNCIPHFVCFMIIYRFALGNVSHFWHLNDQNIARFIFESRRLIHTVFLSI